tara:strand:+ start:16740 stop:17801 length:1062 start_codon:yes stop_codon:yes gene_type:complete
MSTIIRYNSEDIVLDTAKISTSTWADNTNNLTTSFTSSIQSEDSTPTSNGAFYVDVYNQPTGSISSSKEYSVAYGHKCGSGSLDFTNDTGSFGYSPTKCIYSQYRQLVFGDEAQYFTFDTTTPDDIWVINVERKNYKHNLKPSSLNMFLSDGSSTVRLTDDFVTKSGSATLTMAGRQFNIVSGASGVMSGSTLSQTASGSYGLYYPDSGFIILNPGALGLSLPAGGAGIGGGATNFSNGLAVKDSNTACHNHYKLRDMLDAGNYFICDSEEKLTSQYYFTRVKNSEFNYTGNPSYIDTTGTLRFDSMVDNPTVYITTVGLYSDGGDLLAVAKLSKPLKKDFTKESLIKVKVDY